MDKDSLRSIFSTASRDGWVLRSDVQLQEWLETFAESLKERTKEVAADVHRLGTETGNVELLLQNNCNSLRALSATQFIENRVDEVDEVFVNQSAEQPIKQSRVENYDTQIVPRYKEAVLTAWDAFEGMRIRKRKPLFKLPHIIGTEEFMRDDLCGLGDFTFPEVDARAPSSEPVESGSDTDRDEARMAAEMVGGRSWLEGEWFTAESESSGHQGGVLEPAVSAALDFKAMLEAALRGPSFPYDGGIVENLENAHEQRSYVENTLTFATHDSDSNSPRTRSSPEEIKLGDDSPSQRGQSPEEHDVQHQNQGIASEAIGELKKKLLLQPHPIPLPPVLSRNTFAHATSSIGPQSPSISTPTFTPTPVERFPEEPEPSPGTSSSSDSFPPSVAIPARVQTNTTGRGHSPNLRTEESQAQPASEVRPSAVPDNLPMPTLPDGLFQGLQDAIQARQLRSHKTDDSQDEKDGAQKPGEGRASESAEKSSVASRLSPSKLNLKDKRGFGSRSRSKVETTSKVQKGLPTPSRIPGPISFQGGLFDDDDLDEMSDFLSKEGTLTPEIGSNKIGASQSSPLTGPLTSGSSSMVRKGLFDDFGDLSRESPRESEAVGASSSSLVERPTATPQTAFSFPDRKDASRSPDQRTGFSFPDRNRSSMLKKSLFGDSDEEKDDLFGE